MAFTRTGVILYVHNYSECVAFYRDLLGFEILFDQQDLTCFAFGESYLMVEVDDRPGSGALQGLPKSRLRMNVSNVREKADELMQHGIAVDYREEEWGTVAQFQDPDGNLCGFKDNEMFEEQVRRGY